MHDDCPCPQPFRLHLFPSEMHFGGLRAEWIQLINRAKKIKVHGNQAQAIYVRYISSKVAQKALCLHSTWDMRSQQKSRRELIRQVVCVPECKPDATELMDIEPEIVSQEIDLVAEPQPSCSSSENNDLVE